MQQRLTPSWKAEMTGILGFPEVQNTFLEVPIKGIVIVWGLYWGPPILGNYHLGLRA